MVTMQEAILLITKLQNQLDAWVEIADEEDQREEDHEALEEARVFLINAGANK